MITLALTDKEECISYDIRELINDKVHALEQKVNLRFESSETALLLKAQQDLVTRREHESNLVLLQSKVDILSTRIWTLFGSLLGILILMFVLHMAGI